MEAGLELDYAVKRNTFWNRNLGGFAWLVVDAGGIVVYGSDLASLCIAWVESPCTERK